MVSENGINERHGKDVNYEHQVKFFESLGERAQIKATSVLVDGHKAAIEWEFELLPRGGAPMVWKRASIQTWYHGKIMREAIYHI